MSKLEEALEKANKLRSTGAEADNNEPKVPPKARTEIISSPNIITISQPESPISEEFRRLKSILIRVTKSDFKNTIMITSSVEDEGKSITAINLAVTLAQEIDHTILLIDADLRKPKIHEYLGINYKYGLSDYLTRDIDVSDVLVKTNIGKMVVIPAGRMVRNPVELLSSEKMKYFINDIKHRYMDRYVIIDSPPIQSCAEGISIGSYVDGIVFVVKEGLAQRSVIEDALGMIKDFNILGVVYNGVGDVSLDGHYSKYYNKYGQRG